MGRSKGLTSAQLSELFRRFDRPKSKRERACARLNADLSGALSSREIKAMTGMGTEYAPIILQPDTGPGKHLAKLLDAKTGDKSLAGAEQGASLGAAWRRVVEMGCHTEAKPKAIGRYLEPETVHAISPSGVVTPRYRNQAGDPLADAMANRKRTKARIYREKVQVLKRSISDITGSAIATDNTALQEANERTTGDYRRYFR